MNSRGPLTINKNDSNIVLNGQESNRNHLPPMCPLDKINERLHQYKQSVQLNKPKNIADFNRRESTPASLLNFFE